MSKDVPNQENLFDRLRHKGGDTTNSAKEKAGECKENEYWDDKKEEALDNEATRLANEKNKLDKI